MKKVMPIGKQGFTLIELLIVMAIIGILSALTLTGFNATRKNARDTTRKSDLVKMKTFLETYHATYNIYPSTGGNWWGECSHPAYGNHPRSGANGYIPNLAPDFMEELPRDPRHATRNPSAGHSECTNNTRSNCYLYRSNGIDYKLLAHCTPEHYSSNDPFYDPSRATWAWQVHSSIVSKGW